MFYKEFYDNAPDMFISVNYLTQKIIKVNQACLDTLGYTHDELLSLHSVAEIYHPDCNEARREMMENYKKVGNLKDIELILLHKTGRKIYVSFNIKAVKDSSDNILYSLGIYRDISKLVKDREKIKYLNDQLNMKNDEQTMLFHILSHDIQSSIRIIQHSTQWLLEEEKNLPSSTLKYIFMLKNASKQVFDVSHKLVKLYESDILEDLSLISFDTIVEEIKTRLVLFKNFDVHINVDKSFYKTYRFLLTEVLYNLISNAVKHHESLSTANIVVNATTQENDILIEVKDDGPGIPEKLHKNIFEPYKQFNPNDGTQGFGLGLTIVKKILTKFNSHIEIISELNKGTTFKFKWPIF